MDLIEGSKECMIFSVSNTAQEWKDAETKFKKTMP
jgi:hypothetical protein